MCKTCEWFLPIIIIVFTFWTLSWAKWVVLVAAIILLLKPLGLHGGSCMKEAKPRPKHKKRK